MVKQKLFQWSSRLLEIAVRQLAQDINLGRQLHSLFDTVNYVNEKMVGAKVFKDKYDLLRFAYEKALPDGIVAEFGVHTGSTIRFLASLRSNTIHGFDSFEGLPEVWRPGFDKGAFSLNGGLPDVPPHVVLHKGWFSETVPKFFSTNNGPCTLLHIDCDLYSSAKEVFRCAADGIVPGTVIVFDEYFNYPGWKFHEYLAFSEFVREKGLRYTYLAYCSAHEQVAVRIDSVGVALTPEVNQ